MDLRLPRSTRHDTLFPYTTRFRSSPWSTKLLQVRIWRGFTSPIWQRGAADHSEPRSCSTSRCGMLRLRAFCSASNFISFDLNEHANPEKRKARHCWRANLVCSEEAVSAFAVVLILFGIDTDEQRFRELVGFAEDHIFDALGRVRIVAKEFFRVLLALTDADAEIGRASCRERVCQYV